MNTVMEETTHEMAIMGEDGDTKIVWDQDKQDEVDEAKGTFTRLKKKGYIAYSVNRKGDKGELLESFDPSAERIILAPAMQGG